MVGCEYCGMGGRAGQEKERRERRWGGEMRREEEGREVDGEKAVGSIKLIEFFQLIAKTSRPRRSFPIRGALVSQI